MLILSVTVLKHCSAEILSVSVILPFFELFDGRVCYTLDYCLTSAMAERITEASSYSINLFLFLIKGLAWKQRLHIKLVIFLFFKDSRTLETGAKFLAGAKCLRIIGIKDS